MMLTVLLSSQLNPSRSGNTRFGKKKCWTLDFGLAFYAITVNFEDAVFISSMS